jgi:hypothetical protein
MTTVVIDAARSLLASLGQREEKDAMARLSDEEFRAWCQRNNIAPRTEAYIQRIPESDPERRVHSQAPNVGGRYPSVKMGCSLQFESQHCETVWEVVGGESK